MTLSVHRASTSPKIMGLAKIARMAFAGIDLSELAHQLAHRIDHAPDDAAALLDLSIVMQIREQPDEAMRLQQAALAQSVVFQLEDNPLEPSLQVLAIMGPGTVMANTPLEFLVEDGGIALQCLYLGRGLPLPEQLPEHDLAFVAVCESDRNQALLQDLEAVMEVWPRPFVNAPERIRHLSRDQISQNLSGLEGVVAVQAKRMDRRDMRLDSLREMIGLPLIARPMDSHAGIGLVKIEDEPALMQYLKAQDAQEFFVAKFIDYRSEDGWYRKYRVTMIDGQAFAAHMAISQRWMVHYLNADMLTNPINRAQEAAFMASFEQRFAKRHRHALRSIQDRVGLDYYSIDCAETRDGELLVFELDSGAVVHSMDPEDLFPYKRPQMTKVFKAFHRLLNDRARTPSFLNSKRVA